MAENRLAEDREKKAKEKYVELQILDAQMKQFQKQIQAVELQSMELDRMMESLDELAECRAGTEILVPLSSGVFFKAELKENSKFAVNVGANTVVEKSADETKELIRAQALELRRAAQELTEQLDRLAMEAEKLQIELTKLVSE